MCNQTIFQSSFSFSFKEDNNGLFLEIEDIDAGSVVLKQEDG